MTTNRTTSNTGAASIEAGEKKGKVNVREEILTGSRWRRNTCGEYALVLYLVVAVASLVPIVHEMSGATLDEIKGVFDTKLEPVIKSLTGVQKDLIDLKVESQSLADRLSKVEKKTKKAEKKEKPAPPPVVEKEITPKKTMAEAVKAGVQSPPLRDPVLLAKAVEMEERKHASVRPARFRDKDYGAKMAAEPHQVLKAEADYKTGYCIIGTYPNGTDCDVERATDELKEKGVDDPTEDNINWIMLKEFWELDMGMPADTVHELRKDVVRIFSEGNTLFVEFETRSSVVTVYSFSNLMGRMATEKRVVRKLHIWVPVSLESRFFALKNLEFTVRNAKRNAKEKCFTRMYYRDGTIWAQQKSTYNEENSDIPEPASAKIPGVEFWRTTPAPRLNTLKKGAPVHRPAVGSTVPVGRTRKDEANFRPGPRGRGGRGGGRGGGRVGGRGEARLNQESRVALPTTGARALPAPSSSARGNRGVAMGKPGATGSQHGDASQETAEDLSQLSLTNDPGSVPATPTTGALTAPGNDKAASAKTGQFTELLGSGMETAGNKRRRGRKNRSRLASLSQPNRMMDYFKSDDSRPATPVKRRFSARCDSSDEDFGDENKAPRIKSPTKEELEGYMDLAKKMHYGGSLGQARCEELKKLFDLAQKEVDFLKHRKRRITEFGKEDYDSTQLHVDTAIFSAEKKRIEGRLSILGDKTLETVTLDKTLDTDESLFTATSGSSSSSSSEDDE